MQIDAKIKDKDHDDAMPILMTEWHYSKKIKRAEKLAKALAKRRELIMFRKLREFKRRKNLVRYAATHLYWFSDIKKTTIENGAHGTNDRKQFEHMRFMDFLYPVYSNICPTCTKPIYLKSRTNRTDDKCDPCTKKEFDESAKKYKEEVELNIQRFDSLKSMPYSEYLKTGHWQALRKTMLKRAGYRCSLCGESKPLHVHHNTYERRGNERLSDLVVLCHECHESFHEVKHEA